MSWEGIGVIVTAVGVFLTWLHSRESRRIAEEALDLEKSRHESEEEERKRRERARKAADFSAYVGKGIAPGWKPKSMAIENTGNATARNIRVFIDGVPAKEHGEVLPDKCPEPGETRSPTDPPLYIPLMTSGQSPDAVRVKVLWDDDLGSDRSWERTVQI